jgi:hypothetical protein
MESLRPSTGSGNADFFPSALTTQHFFYFFNTNSITIGWWSELTLPEVS